MKYFCFRFDIDSQKCLREGVPNLLALAEEMHVKFTFFVHFGRAVNRLSFIKNKLYGCNQQKRIRTKSLSALTKLGLKDYILTSVANPLIGKNDPHILKMIIKSGHELGLHGGRNHDDWLREAHRWPVAKIREEVLWGQQLLKTYIPHEAVFGFSSPGWNTSKNIRQTLHELGFSYVADMHSDKPIEKIIIKNRMKCVPTNIVGEPDGVGYIEFCRASHMNDSEVLNDFKKKLMVRKKLATVYDHPYYAGIQELKLVRHMIQIAKDMNYKIATMKEITQFV